jgi:hypothetical protein
MIEPTPQPIALTNGDATFYLLPRNPFPDRWRADATWSTADGTLALHRKAVTVFGRDDWHRAAGTPQPVTASRPGRSVKVGYELRNPAAVSEAFPLTRTTLDDLDDDTATALYRTVHEAAEPETVTFTVEAMKVIDGAAVPAPEDGLTWVANITDELQHHPEIHHLFPGHLSGFREAVVGAIKAQPFMRGGPSGLLDRAEARTDRDKPGMVLANRSVPYEPRQTRTVYDERRSRRRPVAREVVETKRLSIALQVPDLIAGKTRAEAVERWHSTVAEILAEVEEALTPAPCWHCQGTGVVSAKAAAGAVA